MARKRHERKNTGLFEVPDGPQDGDGRADSAGVLGAPSHDSRLLGGPGHYSGLFDARDRAPGDLPGLFQLPVRATGQERGEPSDGSEKSVGLFDRPRRGGRA
jgi:hypothetical protein